MVQIQQLKTEIGLGEEMIQLDVISKKCILNLTKKLAHRTNPVNDLFQRMVFTIAQGCDAEEEEEREAICGHKA